MVKENGNVVITSKEMFSILLELKDTHQEILSRLKMIETQLKLVHETDERSREALDIAHEARALAQRLENQLFWFWRTVFGARFI
jgi:hypothetical protein